MEKRVLTEDDILPTSIELAAADSYTILPTATLYMKRQVWLEQRDVPGRSQRSIQAVGAILGKLNFELSLPQRAEEVAEMAALDEALDSITNEV